MALHLLDRRVFILISTGTANNRLCCAIINNQPMYASPQGREKKMSTYTG